MMKEAATIAFKDCDSSDEALVIVRYDDSCVALSLSLKSDGDVEVIMPKLQAKELIKALESALR